ncbi:MAG: hypothetical protein IPI65_01545 [Bacteroidetes bacterium]|nr:hypothetical protein [Bacteroidota bacterium]
MCIQIQGFLFDPTNVNVIYTISDSGFIKPRIKEQHGQISARFAHCSNLSRCIVNSTSDYVLFGYQIAGLYYGMAHRGIVCRVVMEWMDDYSNDNRLYASYPMEN